MKRTLLPWLLGLMLTAASPAAAQSAAQTNRAQYPGEGRARTTLNLTDAPATAAQDHVQLTPAGARLEAGQAAGTWTSKALRVPLTDPRPFVNLTPVLRGQNLHADNLAFAVRTSADGRSWSAWQPGALEGHADDDDARRVGRPQQLDVAVRYVQLQITLRQHAPAATLSGVDVLFYSPGESAAPEPVAEPDDKAGPAARGAATCAKPALVSRAGWGARAASGGRSYTTVTHLIVHHEAGSNTSSNWAARVRAVESLHIDANGWSDVGYNYLVDPNGVIYEGRSGGDNVVGAHFCGGNSNTMAVCMLGDYSSVAPTAAAMNSLKRIMAWKAAQEGINPLGSSTHYAAGFVPNVCGHRDNKGCTACPGSVLYGQLGTLRSDIQSYIAAGCGTAPTADTQAPTTSISAPTTTVSDDFTATFTDADNVGVAERYYQVLESANGTEWRANRGNGFFNDNFGGSTISTDWAIRTGQWIVSTDGRLKQFNTTLTNTNLSTALTQGSGQSYLYQVAAKLNSTTGARRFGLHVMVSDVTATERGESYLVWFSGDDQKVRIIETVSNVLNERAVASLPISAGTWSDYKVSYNSSTGALNVYVNNSLKLSWTDPTPLASGNGFTLRTNQAEVEWDDVKVYKSRSTSKLVTVGPEATQDARRTSPNSTTPAAKVKSIVRDAAQNWSAVGNLDVVVNLPAARLASAGTGRFEATAYPNPLGAGELRLDYRLPRAQRVVVALYDLQGRRLATLTDGPQLAGAQQATLPARQLAAGLYLLKIQGEEATDVVRLMKQ